MSLARPCLALLLAMAACSGDDGPSGVDLTGRYNVLVEGLNGCEQDEALVAWMEGPLSISGPPDDTTFDFGGDFVLTGGTTSSGGFSFGGLVQEADLEYAAFGSGSAEGSAPALTLEGTGGATIDDNQDPSDDCTIEALFSAVQIAE